MQRGLFALVCCFNLLTPLLFAEEYCTFKGAEIKTTDAEAVEKVSGTVRCSYRGEKTIGIEYVYQQGLLKLVREFYRPSGKKKQEYGIFDPKQSPHSSDNRDGVCKQWRESGSIEKEETYEKGRLVISSRYNESGTLTTLEMYGKTESDKKTLIEFTSGGKIEAIYCGTSIPQEKYRKLCGFGGVSKVALHSKDGRVEAYRTFLEGRLLETADLDVDTGKTLALDKKAQEGTEGVKSEFFPNGKIKQEKRYNAKKQYDGLQKEYSEDGNLVREASFENGFMNEERLYYQNGQTKSHTKRVQGDRGVAVDSKHYFDDGQTQYEGSYRELKRQIDFGFGSFWSYQDLEPFGKHTQWFSSGKIESESFWDRGKKVGVWKNFDGASGDLLTESTYDKGVLVRVRTFEDGKLKADEALFPDGSRKSKAKTSAP